MAMSGKTFRDYWQDALTAFFGLVLFLSVWFGGYTELTGAMWNAILFGAVLFVIGISAIMNWRAWEEVVAMLVGLWLVIAPFVFGFATFAGAEGAAYWATISHVVIGVLALITAGWAYFAHAGETASA